MVFTFIPETAGATDLVLITFLDADNRQHKLNITLKTLEAVDTRMGVPDYTQFDYGILDKEGSQKLVTISEPDKGDLKFDEASGTITYTPYAEARGDDKVAYMVEVEGTMVKKQINIHHTDFAEIKNKEEKEIEVKADDQNPILIYALSNFKNIETIAAVVDGVKSADEGKVRVLDAEKGIIEYMPKKGVSRDEFSYTIKDQYGNKQKIEVDLKLKAVEEKVQNEQLEFRTAQDMRSFNYEMVDYLKDNNLKYLGMSDPQNGTVNMLNAKSGLFTFLPKDGFTGSEYIMIDVQDANGLVYQVPVKMSVLGKEQYSSNNMTIDNVSSVEADRKTYHSVLGKNEDGNQVLNAYGTKGGDVRVIDSKLGIVEYKPYPGFSGEDSYVFEYTNSEGDVIRKEMNVFIRDNSAAKISYGELSNQSKQIVSKETNVSQEEELALQESQATAEARKAEMEARLAEQRQREEAEAERKIQERIERQKAYEARLAQREEEQRQREAELAAKEAEAQVETLSEELAQAENEAQENEQSEEEKKNEEIAAGEKELEEQKRREQEQLAQLEEEKRRKAQQAKVEDEGSDQIVFRNILFDFNKSDLRQLSIDELNKIADYMDSHPDFYLQLDGHADWIGTDQYNLALSEKRAKQAFDYLMNKGLSKDRMEYFFFGESLPVAPNANPDGSDNPQGRQLNRRCEFELKKDGTADIIFKF